MSTIWRIVVICTALGFCGAFVAADSAGAVSTNAPGTAQITFLSDRQLTERR
jgi:Na+/H+-translocating membrane pyrophosphatase